MLLYYTFEAFPVSRDAWRASSGNCLIKWGSQR